MTIPPHRDLPPAELNRRRAHLLAEIAGAPPRRAARRRTVPALAVGVAVAVVALLLVAPWQGAPSLTDRALAAIGDEPVLHVVTEQPDWFPSPVDIDTGDVRRQTIRTEIWFDEGRALKRTVQKLDAAVLDETLETPEGGFTRAGPLITCAWIAAHPIEATKRRVSCNENMENGTTPRKIPETPPTVEPTLGGFVDGYRAALDSGVAQELRREELDGREVIWLRFPPPTRPAGAPPFEPTDVAVDAATFRPLRISFGDERDVAVLIAETLPYSDALFVKPELAPPGPSSGRMRDLEPIELGEAARLLGRPPLWLGREWRDFRLVEVRRLELKTGYPRGSGHEPTFADAVRLTYEDEDDRALILEEAVDCHFGLHRGACDERGAREGELRASGFPDTWIVRQHGLHAAVHRGGADVDMLPLARALVPVPEDERGP